MTPPAPPEPTPNLNLRWTHDLSDEDALDRFVGGLTDMGGPCAETLEEVRAAPGGVDLVLHPAALPVQVRVAEEGLTAAAFTLSLGPGYHAHVATALTFAAEQAGFRAAHPSIDSFLASEALEPITQVCEDYFAAQLAIPGRQRHVGVDALRLQHDARYMLPTGPWRADERPHADAVSLWWFAGVTDEMRCRRAEYQMRFVIPPRPPLDELEVARMESVCDDLEGLHERGPDVPALLALRGGWRALHDWLGELRERPKHLDEVAADETLFLRRGPVQVRAQRGAWLTLPSEMSVAWRGDGTFWAADADTQLWVEVHPIELDEGAPSPPPEVVLEEVADWGADTQRLADRFLEWEVHEGAHALHAAIFLRDAVGLLTVHVAEGERERAEALALSVSPTASH